MSTSNKWAVLAGVVAVLLSGFGLVWHRQYPGDTPVALLTGSPHPGDTKPAETTKPAPDAPDPTLASSSKKPDQTAASAPVANNLPAVAPAATPAEPPRFDVVRVEPAGDTLVAGKGEPNAKVALLASGKTVAEARADASGQFVLLPPPLVPGDYDLALQQTPNGKAASTSAQTVAVSVPKTAKGHVMVALAEPGRPTDVLSAPPQVATAAQETSAPTTVPAAAQRESVSRSTVTTPSSSPSTAAKQALAIGSVDLENGNGFYASGTGAPGASVRVYLNNSLVADVVADVVGHWSLTIKKGLAAGHYTVRADAGAGGKAVSARAEVPFDVPASMAVAKMVSPGDSRAMPVSRAGTTGGDESVATPTVRASAPRPPRTVSMSTSSDTNTSAAKPVDSKAPADASRAVIEQVVTRTVAGGDNLWRISRERLGVGHRFTQIYEANADQIRDPNKIYPGQIFVVPPK